LALAGQFTKKTSVMHALADKLPIFLFGLVAAAISTFAVYLSFFALDAGWRLRVHLLATVVAWVSAAASLVFFICGCLQIQGALLSVP
jgi:hypothetical protein